MAQQVEYAPHPWQVLGVSSALEQNLFGVLHSLCRALVITRQRQKSLLKAEICLGKEKGMWRLIGTQISTFLVVSASPLSVSNSSLQGKQGRTLHCWRLSACILLHTPPLKCQLPWETNNQKCCFCLSGVSILSSCKDRYPAYLLSASCTSRHIFLIVLFSLLCYFNLERRRSRIIHLPAFLQTISIPWVFLRDPLFQNTVALSACFHKSSWKSVWVNSVPISSFQE